MIFTALTSTIIVVPKVKEKGEAVNVFIGISQYELEIVTKSDPSHDVLVVNVDPST